MTRLPRRRFLVIETDEAEDTTRIAITTHEACNAWEYIREHDDRETRIYGAPQLKRCIWDNRLGREVLADDLPVYATQTQGVTA